MRESRTIPISAAVNRAVWFQFRDLCVAHDIAIHKGIENAMRDALERAGIKVDGEVKTEAK